jgi:Raf kinase inhibitor-like YbhB/YbcL family protein
MCRGAIILAAFCALALISLTSCERTDPPSLVMPPATISLTSSAFENNAPIPRQYTADGQDISPPLSWNYLPTGAVSLALIVDDPDAPGAAPFCHWLLADIPPALPGILQGAQYLPPTVIAGVNDFGKLGYSGPDPPPGKLHHYHFRLFALDSLLSLGPYPRRADLLNAMNGHMLAQGELIGTYGR